MNILQVYKCHYFLFSFFKKDMKCAVVFYFYMKKNLFLSRLKKFATLLQLNGSIFRVELRDI